MCTLTIIIPTFNSAKTLANCLDTIVNQTFTDFEILLIDGKSTDASLKIIEQYQRKYDNLKGISEKDNGIYDAMNKGIEKANGEWLYFLGSDDELYSNDVLEEISLILTKTTFNIVYGNVLINGDAGWADNNTIYDYEFNLSKLLQKNICHQSIFYKKEIIRTLKFNTDYKICADYDLNLKLFSRYHFFYVNKIIAKFQGGGYSKKLIDQEFNLNKIIFKYYFKKLYLKDFYGLKAEIRHTAKNTSNIFKRIYLNLVFLKHHLFRYESK